MFVLIDCMTTTPANFEQLQGTIAAAYAQLSPQQQLLGRFALERPNELALGTVAAVAEAAGVQPSALIRFANALGFGGFTELQQLFRTRLLERSSSYRERIDGLRRAAPTRAAEAGVLPGFVSDAITELGHLRENVPKATLTAAAQRRAFPIAAYLAYALGQLEVPAQLLDGLGGMLGDALRRMAPKDLLLVASFRPYSPDVVAAAVAAQQRGIAVVAITDTALSPLKAPAAVCFELGQGPNPAFQSLVAPMCLAQALVVSTGHRLAETEKRRRAANGATRRGHHTNSRGRA
jgi:DNA-binding MurR/RpiR family transcriptional regulator